jgi:hypothetical protein
MRRSECQQIIAPTNALMTQLIPPRRRIPVRININEKANPVVTMLVFRNGGSSTYEDNRTWGVVVPMVGSHFKP